MLATAHLVGAFPLANETLLRGELPCDGDAPDERQPGDADAGRRPAPVRLPAAGRLAGSTRDPLVLLASQLARRSAGGRRSARLAASWRRGSGEPLAAEDDPALPGSAPRAGLTSLMSSLGAGALALAEAAQPSGSAGAGAAEEELLLPAQAPRGRLICWLEAVASAVKTVSAAVGACAVDGRCVPLPASAAPPTPAMLTGPLLVGAVPIADAASPVGKALAISGGWLPRVCAASMPEGELSIRAGACMLRNPDPDPGSPAMTAEIGRSPADAPTAPTQPAGRPCARKPCKAGRDGASACALACKAAAERSAAPLARAASAALVARQRTFAASCCTAPTCAPTRPVH